MPKQMSKQTLDHEAKKILDNFICIYGLKETNRLIQSLSKQVKKEKKRRKSIEDKNQKKLFD